MAEEKRREAKRRVDDGRGCVYKIAGWSELEQHGAARSRTESYSEAVLHCDVQSRQLARRVKVEMGVVDGYFCEQAAEIMADISAWPSRL